MKMENEKKSPNNSLHKKDVSDRFEISVSEILFIAKRQR